MNKTDLGQTNKTKNYSNIKIFRNMSLRLKQFILVICLVVVPMAIGRIFTYYQIKSNILNIQNDNTNKSLQSVIQFLDTYVKNQDDAMQAYMN
jgi:hypothetical protein